MIVKLMVEVDVPDGHDQSTEYVRRNVEKMIENNSDYGAGVEINESVITSEFESGAKHERALVRRVLRTRFHQLEAEMVALEAKHPRHGGSTRQEIARKSHVQEGVALALWEVDNLPETVAVVHWRNDGDERAACDMPEPGRVAVDFADVTCEGCRVWLEQYGGVSCDAWSD
jgi:hypothetical protein